MILSLAELITELRTKEQAALAQYGYVGHPTIIGDMYEGLTREILERSLFEGLDLRVVTGKLRWSDGRLSSQLDAMVVVGEGERLPYTDHFIYPLKKVLGVVEVKKTLYGAELADAYATLLSVTGSAEGEGVPVKRFARAFRAIAQRELPANGDLTVLSYEHQMIAATLVRDSVMPLRIVFGYEGYKSQSTLRDGFLRYLGGVIADTPVRGYGPSEFPNLIACGDNALLKLNAMPYSANHDDPRRDWLLYASVTRPLLVLLELLWTRIASEFGLSAEIFGEDLHCENLKPLLLAHSARVGDTGGWFYREYHLSPAQLADNAPLPWEPLEISQSEAVVLQLLGRSGHLSIKETDFGRYVEEVGGEEASKFLERLRCEGIASVDGDGILRYLTEQCDIACIPPEGTWVAAENSTGRLWRWVARRNRAREEALSRASAGPGVELDQLPAPDPEGEAGVSKKHDL